MRRQIIAIPVLSPIWADKNIQIDLYYGPEITTVGPNGHGTQNIISDIYNSTGQCDQTPEEPEEVPETIPPENNPPKKKPVVAPIVPETPPTTPKTPVASANEIIPPTQLASTGSFSSFMTMFGLPMLGAFLAFLLVSRLEKRKDTLVIASSGIDFASLLPASCLISSTTQSADYTASQVAVNKLSVNSVNLTSQETEDHKTLLDHIKFEFRFQASLVNINATILYRRFWRQFTQLYQRLDALADSQLIFSSQTSRFAPSFA